MVTGAARLILAVVASVSTMLPTLSPMNEMSLLIFICIDGVL